MSNGTVGFDPEEFVRAIKLITSGAEEGPVALPQMQQRLEAFSIGGGGNTVPAGGEVMSRFRDHLLLGMQNRGFNTAMLTTRVAKDSSALQQAAHLMSENENETMVQAAHHLEAINEQVHPVDLGGGKLTLGGGGGTSGAGGGSGASRPVSVPGAEVPEPGGKPESW